jgi:hypothetical protein
MQRREFMIAAAAAAVLPARVRADGTRRVGVLLAAAASDPQYQSRLKD